MTYTEKELDQFLHGISLSLLSKKSAQHWRYDEETAKEIEWLEALERKVRADKADRKTENSSEKPNNCEDFFREPTAEERKAVADYIDSISVPTGVNVFDLMDEPTISKMEQVEDETRLTAKCLNCANGGSYKCSKCDGEMYFKDEPQTDCLTCRYNSDEWDSPKCDSCSKAHSNYAPQTDCSWK